jgi:hypothetical protein
MKFRDKPQYEIWSDLLNLGGDNELLASFETLDEAKNYAQQELGRLPEDCEDFAGITSIYWSDDDVCCNIWWPGPIL